MLCSLLIEALALSGLFLIVTMQRHYVIQESDLLITPIFAPPEMPAHPQPAPLNLPVSLPAPQPPKISVPRIAESVQPRAAVPTPALTMPKPPEAQPVPRPPAPPAELAIVHPSEFNTGSSAKPTVKLRERQVQTGGFGDPKGFPGHAEGDSKGNVARLGSFDLPSGPGNGNGTGGARGVRGVVASAGFGSGVAVSRTSSGGAVESSGFGNATAGAGKAEAKTQSGTPDFIPVKIISKPKPIYPAEAKELHLEGEVLLSVNFEASGKVQVLRVTRGLGHGMDESAERAAEAIVFQPARRDSQPVDMQAVVHIIFQLAY